MVTQAKGRQLYLENGHPGQPYVVEADGALEGILPPGLTPGVVLVPVDARVVGRAVVGVHPGGAVTLDTLVHVQREVGGVARADPGVVL